MKEANSLWDGSLRNPYLHNEANTWPDNSAVLWDQLLAVAHGSFNSLTKLLYERVVGSSSPNSVYKELMAIFTNEERASLAKMDGLINLSLGKSQIGT